MSPNQLGRPPDKVSTTRPPKPLERLPATKPDRTANAGVATEFLQVQQVLRHDLSRSAIQAIEMTCGVSISLCWPAAPGLTPAAGPACPTSTTTIPTRRCNGASCSDCLRRDWTTSGPQSCHRFKAPCGRDTFWTDVRFQGANLTRLVVQTLPAPDRRAPRACGARRQKDGAGFRRAIALARLLQDDLQAKAENLALRHDIAGAERRLTNLETEDRRLHRELHDRLPRLGDEIPPPETQPHIDRVLPQALDYIHAHYPRPLSLADVAGAVKLSPSYLCSLFSRYYGVTFHHYLDELRLAKAKELLSDPERKIADVAQAAGYASEDWFRQAFKAHTGLSPSAWRGTAR